MSPLSITTWLHSNRQLEQLSPSQLHSILSMLLRLEASPGGPYTLSPDLKQNALLNLKLYRKFVVYNQNLSGALQYAFKNKRHLSKENQKLIISLTQANPKDSPHQAQSIPTYTVSADHKTIHQQLKRTLPLTVYTYILPLVEKLINMDTNKELTGISSVFHSSLTTKPTAIPFDLRLLGIANFYTWVAYSLYDNAIDQANNALDIPSANLLQRLAMHTYTKAGIHNTKLMNAFNTVDKANAVEITRCRAKVTSKTITLAQVPAKNILKALLFERSIVHTIGPAQIAQHIAQQNKTTTPSVKAFELYCAARQLNDDIHDWQEDLLQGTLTYVVVHLLQKANIAAGTYELPALLPVLQKVYWQSELGALLNECITMAQKAQACYQSDLHLAADSTFQAITTTPILQAAQSALRQWQFDKEFIEINNKAVTQPIQTY